MEIDHEIISTAILLPSTDSRGVVVSYKRKYVHEVLVNNLVKLTKKKVWLGLLSGTLSIKPNKQTIAQAVVADWLVVHIFERVE